MPGYDPNMGVALMAGAQNPDALAAMLADAGIAPPMQNSSGGGLAAILDPMTTGVTKPTAAPPAQLLSPGAPNVGSAIPQQSALLELLIRGTQPGAAQPGLASVLGR